MSKQLKLTGYFAGALFTGQELYGNWFLADAINRVSQGTVQIELPQQMSAQETGDGRGTRAADYLGMIQCDFVLANMNGPELDSGTVAEYTVASMLGLPRVQFRSDFRNVGDVRTDFPPGVTVRPTGAVPYNLMLGNDESASVLVSSMELYKQSSGPAEFLSQLAVAALRGIQLAFVATSTATPEEYSSWQRPLSEHLKLDAAAVAAILKEKRERHRSDGYRLARDRLLALELPYTSA